jgi:hypothetical protein
MNGLFSDSALITVPRVDSDRLIDAPSCHASSQTPTRGEESEKKNKEDVPGDDRLLHRSCLRAPIRPDQ